MYLNKKKQSGSFFNKLHCTERQSGNLKKSYRIILQKSCIIVNFVHSRVRNKHSPTLINFLTFFQELPLHRAYFNSISIRYKWGYSYSFCQIFKGLWLFKELSLFQTLDQLQIQFFGAKSIGNCKNVSVRSSISSLHVQI